MNTCSVVVHAGVPLLDGGTVRLPQLIGHSRAMDLILTGRPVSGKEALELGLANQLVKTGSGNVIHVHATLMQVKRCDITCFSAIGVALNLALSLCRFPQECLNRDRRSAYYSCYDARSYDDAFKFEWENAVHVVQQESVQGLSQRFIIAVIFQATNELCLPV